jgi:hypothetical protein
MKDRDWTSVREELRRERPPTPRAAEGFWSEFKARASLVPQDAPAAPAPMPLPRWSLAILSAAAVLVVSLAVLAPIWQSRQGGDPAVPVGIAATTLDNSASRLKFLRVVASHSAVVIMSDEDRGGTVVWISDMELD